MHRFVRWSEDRNDHHLVLALNKGADAGKIVSFALFVTDPTTLVGELDPVGTMTTHRRWGLSRLVLLRGLNWLQEAGMQSAVVRTGVDNLPAIATYSSAGFSVVDHLYTYNKR